jgi:hypothetical protein
VRIDSEGPTHTKVYTTEDGRTVIEQPTGSVVLILPALATKKTGRQIVEGLYRKAHFPPVHARTTEPVPSSYTTTRWRGQIPSAHIRIAT